MKQRGYVINDDKSNLQITVEGMDFLEANRPSPEYVMPFIKPSAIAEKGKVEVSVFQTSSGLMGARAPHG